MLQLWSQFSEQRSKIHSEALLLGVSVAGPCSQGSLADRNNPSPLLHALLRRAWHQVWWYLLSFWTRVLTWCSSPQLISSRKGGGLSFPEELIWWWQGSSGMLGFWSQALWVQGYKLDFLFPGRGNYGTIHRASMGTFVIQGNRGHNTASLSTEKHLRQKLGFIEVPNPSKKKIFLTPFFFSVYYSLTQKSCHAEQSTQLEFILGCSSLLSALWVPHPASWSPPLQPGAPACGVYCEAEIPLASWL